MNKKRFFALLTAAAMTTMLAACGGANSNNAPQDGDSPAASGPSGAITVVSREDGSGTRGAFVELTGVLTKDANGNKVDMTTQDAIITNKTDVMLSNVAGDVAAIGYVSMGSLSNDIKALKVDGAEATAENVKSGSYKVVRPFNIATKGEPTGVAKDFINYILSSDGQAVVSNSYIAAKSDAAAFTSDGSSGKLVIGGSSSVSPLMEKLIEGYQKINGSAEIELQTSDSTSGMTGAIDGTFGIGMASRELSSDEASQLTFTEIALDGIAIIVNKQNTVDNITTDQIREIFTGEMTDWADLA